MENSTDHRKKEKQLLVKMHTNNKPAMVEVRAEWSGGSHLMDLIINKIEDEFQNQLRVVRIDFETHKELLSQFGVDSAPAVLFISRGQVVEVIKETLSRKNLEKLVRGWIIRDSTSIEEINPVITDNTKINLLTNS